MQMILAKEKLNLFMKGQDVDLDDIYERFGVDYDLLSLLMRQERDDKGNLRISWGGTENSVKRPTLKGGIYVPLHFTSIP